MQTPTDRLDFAIAFADLKLDELRPGDWLNLRDDLREFTGVGKLGVDTSLAAVAPGGVMAQLHPGEPSARDLLEPQIVALQSEFRQLLGALADGMRRAPATPGAASVSVTVYSPVEIKARYSAVGLGQAALITATGSARDISLLRLIHLLAQGENANRVRRCPDCGRLFFRKRRQLYCSKKCVNRVNKRDKRSAERAATVPNNVPAPTKKHQKPTNPTRGGKIKTAR
jgi:hypothetical protein